MKQTALLHLDTRRRGLAAILVTLAAMSTVLFSAPRETQTIQKGTVTGACNVSPIVADLDRAAHFYHDLIGLDIVPSPAPGPLPWDTNPGHLDLHGMPKARLRFIGARMTGVTCGVEMVEFGGITRQPVHRRMQDPGAVTLILLVRDIDSIFSRLKAAGVPIVTTSGAPMTVGASRSRAVIVTDPDGHFVELAQLNPIPETTAAATSNVIGIRFRITVADTEKSVSYYRQTLGLEPKSGEFTKGEDVMAMMGLPTAAEYKVTTSALPGSTLLFEFIEFKGVPDAKTIASRVQDPGSYRLQLNVRDIDFTLNALKKAGATVISSGGVPVSMTFGANRWRLAVAQNPNNLFLVIQQQK